MKIQKIIKTKPTKENNFSKLSKSIPTTGGIYFIFDKNLELIYIGKSKNIRSRILQHSTDNENSRLHVEDKGTYFEQFHTTCIPIGVADYYSYILEGDEFKRGMIETFFLCTIKTRFNCSDKIKAIKQYKEKMKRK